MRPPGLYTDLGASLDNFNLGSGLAIAVAASVGCGEHF